MKRTYQSAFSTIRQTVTNTINYAINWFNPAAGQPQPIPQQGPAPQAPTQNQDPATTTAIVLPQQDLQVAMHPQGDFLLPFEVINHIFQFVPLVENRWLREVSKPFLFSFDYAAKFQIRTLTPATHNLDVETAYNAVHTKQQAEIKYLTENKDKILGQNNNNPNLIEAFAQLALLEKNPIVVAYHAKEECLNNINEAIIRNQITSAQQSYYPTQLHCRGCHLTRFPSSLFSDNALAEFWGKLTLLDICYNQLTSLPDTIGQLKALVRLYVYHNQLTSLPATIGQLKALQGLEVTQNYLSALPNDLREDILYHQNEERINKTDCLENQKKLLNENKDDQPEAERPLKRPRHN